jgi:hypothetical protein
VRSRFASQTRLRAEDQPDRPFGAKIGRDLRRWVGRALAERPSRAVFGFFRAGNAVWGQGRNHWLCPIVAPF